MRRPAAEWCGRAAMVMTFVAVAAAGPLAPVALARQRAAPATVTDPVAGPMAGVLAPVGAAAPPGGAGSTTAIASDASGSDPVATLEQANDAYLAGDFRAAITGYRALVAAGHGHPLLQYNLGNAYLRQGELGRAIASYRRAAAGAPRNQDVRANLAFARRSARDAVAPPEPPMVWRTVFAWHYALAPSELWLAAVALNVLLWSLLAIRLWRRHEALTWAAAATSLLLVACGLSIALHTVAPSRVAVVVPREVNVRSGLREDTVVRFKLHAGSEVLVREERDGWLRIALPGGEQGWIEVAAAEVVEL